MLHLNTHTGKHVHTLSQNAASVLPSSVNSLLALYEPRSFVYGKTYHSACLCKISIHLSIYQFCLFIHWLVRQLVSKVYTLIDPYAEMDH